MNKKEILDKINNELKSYINESSFISIKCRNKLLKIFEEEFNISLDISNYKNVDLFINDDFSITYREDKYISNDKINSISDIEERYNNFIFKADKLLERKNIDFQNKSNMNNISNLIIIIGMVLLFIIVIYFGVIAFISGDYFDCLWFLVVILPWIFPKFKDSFTNRFIQAKRYIKSLFKRVK